MRTSTTIARIGEVRGNPRRRDPEGFTPLHRAAFAGETRHLRFLLAAGISPNLRSSHPGGCAGATPLHLAVAGGQCRAVEELLSAGANVATTDDAGYTPLHLAAERGVLPIVRLLLRAGADVDVWIGETTPLDLARRGRHAEVAGLLRQLGAR